MSKANTISKNKKGSADIAGKKKKNNPVIRFIMTLASISFAVYCISSFVVTQAEIAERKHELTELQIKASQLESENEEYQSILSEEDERTYMERIAIETLGYAYPNERRFYDTTRS